MDVTLRVVGYALEDLWRDWRRFPTPQCGVSEGTLFSAITIKKRTSSGHHNVKTITIRQYNGRCNGDGLRAHGGTAYDLFLLSTAAF